MKEEQKKAVAVETKEVEQVSLLDEIAQATKLKPSDEAYSLAKRGIEALISQLLEPGKEGLKVSKAVLDSMIAEIDKKLSLQLDAILHQQEFQKLESAWRSLKFLVDGTDFRENVKLEVLQVTKDQLLEDFEDAPEVPKSGLYKTVYTSEYGTFGGKPYAALIGNYDFSAGPQDIKLLQY
ncbi:MAG: tssC, partial [Deltaproteobacteria bacterium]|nr:tssC [Deltaproteobacteria bacterium]